MKRLLLVLVTTVTVVTLSAVVGEKRCAPLRGSLLHVMKDEAELDIDFGRCR